MEQDRRRTPRYPFTAPVEVVETSSGAKATLKITELSLNGCYVNTPTPMENGTELTIKVVKDSHFFESPARVVYAQENQGMGLMFHDVKPYFAQTLQRWILEAMLSKRTKPPQN